MFIRLIIRHLHYNIFKSKEQFLIHLIISSFFLPFLNRTKNIIFFGEQGAKWKEERMNESAQKESNLPRAKNAERLPPTDNWQTVHQFQKET